MLVCVCVTRTLEGKPGVLCGKRKLDKRNDDERENHERMYVRIAPPFGRTGRRAWNGLEVLRWRLGS